MTKDTVTLKFEGKNLNLRLPIYLETNRYYLPFTEVITQAGGKSKITANKLNFEINNIAGIIDLQTNYYNNNGQQVKLKKALIVSKDLIYISLYDLCKILDLRTDWDIENKVLSLYLNREKVTRKETPVTTKAALIRLEDIAPGYLYNRTEQLEKLRIVTDYLYQENVPFHVAWIPRYIDPKPASGLDNDLSKANNMLNADFIYTLDYMSDKNGFIGLHGYTHQYGNTESASGAEFHQYANDGIPDTEQYAQERVNLAVEAARKLDIPYCFFEAPHYAISPSQVKVLEKNFPILYEYFPNTPNQQDINYNSDKTCRYIPTPLNYVNGKSDCRNMLTRINNIGPHTLASFFYHPFLEFDDINISKDSDGYPQYTYNDNSILHQIVNLFKKKGYQFTTVNDVK
jgi:Uncharacterized protein conserved in bacteria (DUF2334)./Copper amine oxidase N-terminal domain.